CSTMLLQLETTLIPYTTISRSRQLEAGDRRLQLARQIRELADGFRRLARAARGQRGRLPDLGHARRYHGGAFVLLLRVARHADEIGRAHVLTSFTLKNRIPLSG